MKYYDEILALAEKVKENNPLIDLFQERSPGRTPTQAFSQFLTNREQGDYAEALISQIINQQVSNLVSIPYGRTENIIAGDPKFKEFFQKYQIELSELGKCPDLLVFLDHELDQKTNNELISDKPRNQVIKSASKAIAGLEVRSSSFLVNKYNEHISKLDETQLKGKRTFLSFTPKVEDLAVILTWIRNHDVPHYYVQVFFDSIHIISYKKILEILSNPENHKQLYTIEKNSKNQFKSTIHIKLSEGICLSDNIPLPLHQGKVKELDRGRLLFYVSFGIDEEKFEFDDEKFKGLLLTQKES